MEVKRKLTNSVSIALVVLQLFYSTAFAGFLYLPFNKFYNPVGYVGSYPGHTGTDYRGAGYETPVYAAYDGKVVAVVKAENDGCDITKDQQKQWGNYVKIDHQVGSVKYRTEYWHLKQNGVVVKYGDNVKTGDLIAYVSNSGLTVGSDCPKHENLPNGAYYHLHFEVKKWDGSKWVVLNPYNPWLWTSNPPTPATQAVTAPYLIKTSTSGVWLVLGGKKHPISDFDTISVLGFQYPQDVRVVSSTQFNGYPNGPLIPYIKDYWIAQYYSNKSWGGPFKAIGSFSALTNLRWYSGSPDPAIPADNFSAIFSKKVDLAAGTYDFAVGVDDGAKVYLDGVLIGSVGQGQWSGSFSKTVSAGWHILQVRYWESGGLTYLNLSYTLRDTSGPQISASFGTESQNGWFAGNVPVTIVASDPSGIAKIAYRVNGGDWIQVAKSSITPVFGAEGVNTLAFKALDNRGNWSTEKSVSVPIDFTPPVTELSADGPVYENEEGEIFVSSETSFGLYADDANQDPEIGTSGVSQTTFSVDEGEAQSYDGDFSLDGLDGRRVINYASSDLAGNVESTNSQEAYLDSAAPVSSDDSDGQWHNEDVTVTIISQDPQAPDGTSGSGVQGIVYDGTQAGSVLGDSVQVTYTEEGTHELTYYAVDNVENVEEEKETAPIKIDKTPPTIVGTPTEQPNGNNWYNSDVTVHFKAEDQEHLSGVKSVTPDVDVVVSAEGENQEVIGTAEDNAGNAASTIVSGINIDKTPPESTLQELSPYSNNNLPSDPIVVPYEALDNLSGVDRVRLYKRYQGGDWEYHSGSSREPNRPFVVGTLDEGRWEFSSCAVDQADNEECDVHTVGSVNGAQASTVYDVTPPTSQIMSVETDAYYNIWPGIFGSASDEKEEIQTSGVAQVEVRVDKDGGEGKWSLAEGTDVWNFEFASADGNYTVYFRATDRASNRGDTGDTLRVSFVYDSTPPITSANPEGLQGLNGWHVSPVGFTLSVADANPFEIYYVVNGSDRQVYVDQLVFSDGVHALEFWSVDKAGNEEAHQTLVFKIDTVAPTVPVTLIAGGSFFVGEQTVVSLSAEGGTHIYYSINGGEPILYTESLVISESTTLSAYAVDEAGNRSAEIYWNFVFDFRPIVSPQVLGISIESSEPLVIEETPVTDEEGSVQGATETAEEPIVPPIIPILIFGVGFLIYVATRYLRLRRYD